MGMHVPAAALVEETLAKAALACAQYRSALDAEYREIATQYAPYNQTLTPATRALEWTIKHDPAYALLGRRKQVFQRRLTVITNEMKRVEQLQDLLENEEMKPQERANQFWAKFRSQTYTRHGAKRRLCSPAIVTILTQPVIAPQQRFARNILNAFRVLCRFLFFPITLCYMVKSKASLGLWRYWLDAATIFKTKVRHYTNRPELTPPKVDAESQTDDSITQRTVSDNIRKLLLIYKHGANPTSLLSDVRRGTMINGKCALNYAPFRATRHGVTQADNNILAEIDRLLHPVQDEEARTAYKEFILRTGGQGLQALFIDLLHQKGRLYDHHTEQQVSFCIKRERRYTSREHENWQRDAQGRIYCDFSTVMHSLHAQREGFILTLHHNGGLFREEPMEATNGLLGQLRPRKPWVYKAQARLYLNFVDGELKPSIEHLDVRSNTPDLKFYNEPVQKKNDRGLHHFPSYSYAL